MTTPITPAIVRDVADWCQNSFPCWDMRESPWDSLRRKADALENDTTPGVASVSATEIRATIHQHCTVNCNGVLIELERRMLKELGIK